MAAWCLRFPSLARLQIVSPMDERIADRIAHVGAANEVPVATRKARNYVDETLVEDYSTPSSSVEVNLKPSGASIRSA